MKRVRTKQSAKIAVSGSAKPSLAVMNEMVNRAVLASRIGVQTYGGDRDIYQALGYPNSMRFADYAARYSRQDIAKAVIDRPVKASWKGEIDVIENQDEKETSFESDWIKLYEGLKLKSIFIRADKITGIGRYSVLLLGTSDLSKVEDFEKPLIPKKGRTLVYVKPLSEASAKIHTIETDVKNPRYGKPLLYQLSNTDTFTQQGDLVKTAEVKDILVHYTRVVHLVEDILENEVYGTPRLQVVFNRLIDLEKIVGGDAEMFWRGARPGYTGNVKEDYQMTTEALKDMQDQIDEFEHNLKRVLVNEGVDFTSLAQQIADPSAHVDVQIQMVSAVTGIPKRILVGSERGELSSAQDKQEWISYVSSRREEQNEPMILRPFIDALIELQLITSPADNIYTVVWDKLFSLSDKEKVELGRARAFSLKMYGENPVLQKIMPIELFLQYVLGLSYHDVQKVLAKQEEEADLEPIKMSDFEEEEEEVKLPKSISEQPIIEQEV